LDIRYSTLHFGHAVVHTEEQVGPAPAASIPSFVDEELSSFEQFRTVDKGNSTVSAGDLFGLLKAEAAEVTYGSDFPTGNVGVVGLGAVFDQSDVSFLEKLMDRVDISRTSEKMDQNDSACFSGNFRSDGFGRHVSSERIDIGEDWDAIASQDGDDASHVGNWGSDDFATGVWIPGSQSHVQSRGSRG
jgi:hypothetical protein